MKKYLVAITLLLVFIGLSHPCFSFSYQTTGDDSTITHPKKLFFDLECAPHYSSISSYKKNGVMVSLGLGYLITSNISTALRIYTGSEFIPSEYNKPRDGWLSLGGGGIETAIYPWTNVQVKPFFIVGFNLYTILNYGGYNGGGLHVAIGTRYDFFTYFSISASARYTYIYFHGLVNDDDAKNIFEPFTDQLISLGIRLSFYPSIFP